jgi:ubiquinone biosynthesis protein Coq4
MTIATAVEQYMQTNGFTREEYTAKSVPVKVGPLVFRLPNGPARQRAIAQHDVHHVLTGYATDLTGEAEIGAFELRAGCTSFFLYMINIAAVVAGLFIAPRRVLRAWKNARGARTLYALGLASSDVERLEVGALRELAGVPHDGYA